MIGEFHFGNLDSRSYRVGIKKAKDQAERGQMYQDYIQGALRHPNIVDAHSFQYLDESITDCFDGENYNLSFIDISDNPYEELIKKVKKKHTLCMSTEQIMHQKTNRPKKYL